MSFTENSKRLLLAVAMTISLIPGNAFGACASWHNLTNGTTANADYVMENFGCLTTNPEITGGMTIAGSLGVGANPTLGRVQIDGSGNQVLAINASSNSDSTIRLYRAGTMKWRIYNNAGGNSDGLVILDAGEDNGVYLAQNSNSWASASDVRLKRNIQSLAVLDRLSGFRAVSFNWRSNGNHDIGVIAQELDKVFPELVHRGSGGPLKNYRLDQGGTWSVDYSKLGAIALAGVKELNEDVTELRQLVQAHAADAQQKRLSALETENAALNRQVRELVRSVASLERRVALRTARK